MLSGDFEEGEEGPQLFDQANNYDYKDDESLPDLSTALHMNEGSLARWNGLNYDDASLGTLPQTTSLPTFTIPSNGIPSKGIPSKEIQLNINKPRENLATVLKKSEKLLRETHRTKYQRPVVPSRGKLTNFLQSLQEETEAKRKKKIETIKSNPLVRKLVHLVPDNVLSRKPKLSMECAPEDFLEIVETEEKGNKSTFQSFPSKRSLQIVRQAIAPRAKKLSITRLNEQVNEQISHQQKLSRAERKEEQKKQEEAKKRVAEARQQEKEEGEAGGNDEFGMVDEGVNEKMDKGVDEIKSEDEALESLVERPLESRNRLIRGLAIESDEEEANKRESTRKGLIMHSDISSSEGEEEGKEKDILEASLDSNYQEEELGILDEPLEEMEMNDVALTQMLSGKFDEPDDEEPRALKSKFMPSLRKLFDEEAEEEDSEQDQDDWEGEEKEEGEEGEEEEKEEKEEKDHNDNEQGRIKSSHRRRRHKYNDEIIDEEAIAKELKESAFLVDTQSEEENDDYERPSALAIHHALQQRTEEAEIEMFINRFVPDKVLREQGAYGQLKYKYGNDAANDLEFERGQLDIVKNNPKTSGKSTFGDFKGEFQMEPTRSHPEFLKLLEQDQFTEDENEDEDESEKEDVNGYEREKRLDKGRKRYYFENKEDKENDSIKDKKNGLYNKEKMDIDNRGKEFGYNQVDDGDGEIGNEHFLEQQFDIMESSLEYSLGKENLYIELQAQEKQSIRTTTFSPSNSWLDTDHLHQRLQLSATNNEDGLTNVTSNIANRGGNRSRMTFDTVSSRPLIVKEKFKHGKK